MAASSNKNFNDLSDKIFRKVEENKRITNALFEELKTDYKKISETEKGFLLSEIDHRINGLEKLIETSKEAGLLDKISRFQKQIESYKRIKSDLENIKVSNSDTQDPNNKENSDPEKEELKEENNQLKQRIEKLEKELSEIKELLKNLNEKKEKEALDEKEEKNEDVEEKDKENIEAKESSEILNKQLFVNRDNLAEDIAKNRFDNGKNSINNGIPHGEIVLKTGVKIRIEDQKSYPYFKDEYQKALANKDEKLMRELDTEFAERIILDNPPIDDITKRYYIQINNDMPGKDTKSQEELEKESNRCLESLKKLGYNVEYVKYTEKLNPEINDEGKENLKESYLNKIKKEIDRLTQPGKNLTPLENRSLIIYQSLLDGKYTKKKIQERIAILEQPGKNRTQLEDRELNILKNAIQNFEKEQTEKKKSKIYHIIRQKKIKKLDPEPEPEYKDIDLSAVISDMGTDVHRERVSLETEEELKNEYKKLNRYRLDKKAYLFLSRGAKRKRMIKEKMEKLSGKAFSGDDGLDDKTTNAADRHELEKNEYSLKDIISKATVDDPKVNELCKNYLEGNIDENLFKDEFNKITADNTTVLGKALEGQKDIKYLGTNILAKLNLQKANFDLINSINSEFNAYVGDSNNVHIDNINKSIEDYINKFQKTPEFMGDYQEFLNNTPGAKEKLIKYLKHQKAIMKMQVTNLKINLDIVTGGKSAYQIDNKDRQKGIGYKVGKALDKLPRWAQTAGIVGISVGAGLLTGGLGSFAGAARVTGTTAGSIGGLNALKKRTHYTKEQNTHEKNIATDYKNEQEKITQRQNQILNGKRYQRKTYKAKRQLKLYNDATQKDFHITNDITNTIMLEASKVSGINNSKLQEGLIAGLARLDYYREIGHNFLASENKEKIESDFNKLEKTIILGLHRLGTDLETFRQKPEISALKDTLKTDYDKSFTSFKKERRILAAKYGISTAALSAGMSGVAIGIQYLTGTGIFADSAVDGVSSINFAENSVDTFDLGKAELLDTATRNDLYNTGVDIFNNPNVIDGSTITINYGAGTDATAVIPGRLTEAVYQSKIDTVINNINSLNLDGVTKDALIDHVKSQPWTSSRETSNFMNDYLHGMRCSEAIEQVAKSIADSGRTDIILNLNYDSTMDIVGKSIKDASERVVNANFVVNTPEIAGIAERSRGRFLQFPVFFANTFKDKVELKDNDQQDKIQDKKPKQNPDDGSNKPKDGQEDKDNSKEINTDDIDDYKPTPTDPTQDPDNFYKDDIGPKKDLKGKKTIITRGQKIDGIDKSDYGKQYPGSGEIQSEKETAYDIVMKKKKLSPEDKEIVKKMKEEGKTYTDIMDYMESKVKHQRVEAKEKADSSKWAFNKILEECYTNIPKYLEKILGPELSKKFNQLPDSNRIHLVGEYDYLSIDGEGFSGVFRTESGDIYVSQKAVQQFENAPDIGSFEGPNGQTVRFPRIYREIKHILIHEMLHSMSVINYDDFNQGDNKILGLISARRMGFMNINNRKMTLRGRGLNEGVTETLTQEILRMRYNDEGLINYTPPWIAYQKEKKIIETLIQTDQNNLELKDFYKVMLLRKYGDGDKIEWKTPLVELIKKINGQRGTTEEKKLSQILNSNNPYYYQLIMSLLDYVNDKNVSDIQFILEFIQTKDISIIKDKLGNTLDIVFDSLLLNKSKNDFNDTILKNYKKKS